jgi:hypothetical protein
VADHRNRAASEKATQLLAILRRYSADIFHRVSAKATHEEIVGALKYRYRDHQLAVAYLFTTQSQAS